MWYGIGQFFYSTQYPDYWLPCNGALIPSEYTAAKAVLGSYMPDLRNRFPRIRDSQNIGFTEEDSLKAHSHKIELVTVAASGSGTYVPTWPGSGNFRSTHSEGGTETRPKSVYFILFEL